MTTRARTHVGFAGSSTRLRGLAESGLQGQSPKMWRIVGDFREVTRRADVDFACKTQDIRRNAPQRANMILR